MLFRSERERAWQRYHEIRRFVDAKTCRHLQVCLHFGEKPKWSECGACDVCIGVPEWMAAVEEPKRPKRRKGTAALPPPPAKRQQPASVKADLAVTDADSELVEYLREWRRETAKKRGVPAYIVMHDTTLEDICRKRPASRDELLDVSGIGERKAVLYGDDILAALERFCTGSRAAPVAEAKPKPAEETIRLLAEGHSFEEIARIRGRQLATVVNFVADLVERGEIPFQLGWVNADKQTAIEAACQQLGVERLNPLKAALPTEFSYEEIRLVVARLRRQRMQPEPQP